MPTSKHTHPVGAEVTYRHKGEARKAQVTAHHPDSGEVDGLAVLKPTHEPGAPVDKQEWVIEFGVSAPKHAETPQHEITDGYFKRR